jgi:thymidylate synthase (FAD)
MKIVEPSVELIHCTPNPERVIERFGRICYQSQHKVKTCEKCGGEQSIYTRHTVEGMTEKVPCSGCNGTGTDISSAITFVKVILSNGHVSVLEHASAGFSIITDRGVTHEIVRHRIASFSQESTRYCNYGKDQFGREITVVEPPGLREPDYTGSPLMADGDLCAWASVMEGCEHIYMEMLDRGVAPQIARSVLPNSLKAEIGMTANFREWRHFLSLRTSLKAHPQMRQIANMLQDQLIKISPAVFEDFKEGKT